MTNKTILLILFGVCLVSAGKLKAENKLTFAPTELLSFLKGFAFGLQSEVIKNENCLSDFSKTFIDLKMAFIDLEEGFSNKSVILLEHGLSNLGLGIFDLAMAYKDCGLFEISTDITLISKKLTSWAGFIKVIVTEVINIYHHGQEITAVVTGMLDAFTLRKYFEAGAFMGRFIGILISDQN